MPTNVEIKARVCDIENLRQRAVELSGSEGELLEQEDTFFTCQNGRLKLRIIKGKGAQLISYERPDEREPKLSNFHIADISDPENLKIVLSQALSIRGVVRKKRYLFIVGQTRIHVDQVTGLGNFLELEVMMKDGQTVEEGRSIASEISQKLGVKQDDLLTGAYMDLILEGKKGTFLENEKCFF